MAGYDDLVLWLFPMLVVFIIIILLFILKRKPRIRNRREREIQEAIALIRRLYNAGRPENVIITTLMKLGFNTEEISEILKRAKLG